MLHRCFHQRLHSVVVFSVRNCSFEAHGFDHSKGISLKDKHKGRTPKPAALRITIPVPVQNRAIKRARDPKKIQKDLDKANLKNKHVIISAKNTSLNHKLSQTYGKFDKLPLVSGGWHHRKSIGDYFTINPFMAPDSTSFRNEFRDPPTFRDYDLDPRLVEALTRCGFTKSTNIQHEAIPKMLEFSDCNTMIAAETGNGKTLAFLIPMLNSILKQKDVEESVEINAPYGVVVTPGRELADQIGSVAESLCHYLGLNVKVLKGGQIRKQILFGPREDIDLVVGTQGGLSKLFHENYVKRHRVSSIALDEIDTLLDDTFKDDVINFLKQFGQSGQSLLTGTTILMAGATFPTNFENYLEEIMDMQDVLKVSTSNIHRMLFHIPQKFMRVSPVKKTEALLNILEKDAIKKKKILIFSNKSSTADFVQIFLKENNIDCVNFNAAHGYKYRREILDKFLSGEVPIMSSTDIMSRGIDTQNVAHVINYDFPLNPADYIHRVGRVGRVGGVKNGHVTSLVDNAGGVMVLQNLETAVRKNIEIQKVNNNIIRIIEKRAERKTRKFAQ